MYTVKEIFYTLQGEGRQSGRAAVFCRFTGCNLWSGRERHRSKALCQVGGPCRRLLPLFRLQSLVGARG